MTTPPPLGGGIDVDVPPDFPEGGFANIPYQRSGTQIFEDPNRKRSLEDEEIVEEEVHITDQYLEQLWDQYNQDPNFFSQIEIAQDGGFSEVDELVGGMRYFTAALALGFVVMNVYALLSVNIGLIRAPRNENTTEIFLVTKLIFEGVIRRANQSSVTPGIVIRSMEQFISNDQAILGWLVVALVSVYVLRMVLNIWQIALPKNDMQRWQGVQELFWNSLPEAATISEVKVLNYVTPAVLLPAFTQALVTSQGGCLGCLWAAVAFLFTRALCMLVGFDAFLFKLQTISAEMIQLMSEKQDDPGASPIPKALAFGDYLTLLALSGAFLNQMLGIVQLGWFVRKRIFAFIFAGEDGQLSAEEEALKETWESMLAQRIWQDLPPKQAIVAYLSYSDYDFQKLALETVKDPNAEKKPPSERKAQREKAAGMGTELVSQS